VEEQLAHITSGHLAALSLGRAAEALGRTACDRIAWFFVILDLHRALQCALTAKQATQSIPIVFFQGGDPVKLGFVASLHRPGANITGASFLTDELIQKRVEVLHELFPKATVIGLLVNPSFSTTEEEGPALQPRQRGSSPNLCIAAVISMKGHMAQALHPNGSSSRTRSSTTTLSPASRTSDQVLASLRSGTSTSARIASSGGLARMGCHGLSPPDRGAH